MEYNLQIAHNVINKLGEYRAAKLFERISSGESLESILKSYHEYSKPQLCRIRKRLFRSVYVPIDDLRNALNYRSRQHEHAIEDNLRIIQFKASPLKTEAV